MDEGVFKYIVPIYLKKEFVGTGFIVDNYFITAAHVVQPPCLNYMFKYDGEDYRLRCSDLITREYWDGNLKVCNNELQDLIVFRMKGIESPLVLMNPQKETGCYYCGYSFNEETHLIQPDYYENIAINNKKHHYYISGKSFVVSNCFLADSGRSKKGNSGGPLFQGQDIIGMLVGKQQGTKSNCSKDRFIRAEYIKSKLCL